MTFLRCCFLALAKVAFAAGPGHALTDQEDMVQKANKKGSNLGVTDEQLLLRYAVTMAQRP